MNDIRTLGIRLILILLIGGLAIGEAQAQKRKKKDTGTEESDRSGIVNQVELERESLFIEGLKQKLLGNYEDAVGIFQAVIRLDDENHAAYYELARIFYESSDFESARQYAMRAVALNPGNEWYYIYLAESQAKLGDFVGAAQTYEKLIGNVEDAGEFEFDLAFMWTKAGKLEKAIDVFDRLEKEYGVQESIILQKENLYIKLGEVEKAAGEIRKLIREFPEEFRYYGILGELYEANDYYDEAEDAYNRLLEISPSNPEGLMSLANVYKKRGDEEKYLAVLDELFNDPGIDIDSKILLLLPYIQRLTYDTTNGTDVLNIADRIVEAHPEDPRSHTARADILLYLDRIDEAKSAYKVAIGKGDCPITVWNQLMAVLADEGDFEELVEFAAKASERFPEEIIPAYFEGFGYIQLKDYQKGVDIYKPLLEKLGESPEMKVQVLSLMGDAYNELKQYALSDAAFDDALVIDPNNAYVLNNYAYYLSLREDKLDQAASMSKKANILVENNAAFQDTYAWVLYKQNRLKEAREWMEKALSNMEDQERPVLLEHYGDILFKMNEVDEAVNYWNKALEAGGDRAVLEYKIRNKALPK